MSPAAGVRGHGVGSIVIHFTTAEMASELVAPGRLAEDRLNAIVRDLTYDPSIKHTDIFFQPLVEIAPGEFLVSPSVITGSAWERNLLKLWSNKYPDRYAATVGLAKNKLTASIAGEFARLGFPTTSNRELRLAGSSAVTDVDVAVFDPMAEALALAEVKWLTEPADPREVRRADDEVAKGIKQVRAAAAFVRQHPAIAEKLLFPSGTAKFTESIRIRALVIGRGHVGSRHVADPHVPILDYGLVAGLAATTVGSRRLEGIIDLLLARMRAPQRGTDYRASSVVISLAGYCFHIPAFRPRLVPPNMSLPSGEGIPKASRNDLCPCGSGLKYKRCHGQ